jgi:hypothetical protein
MIAPKRQDYVRKVVSQNGLLGTTVQFTLSREFWLESAILSIEFSVANSAVGAATPEGLSALLKKARMSITDATGNRKNLDVTGSALIGWCRQTIGNTDRVMGLRATSAPVLNTSYTLYYYIPFRDPVLQEPWGSATMLALPRLSNDPVIEFDLDAGTGVSATFSLNSANNATFTLLLNRRDMTAYPNFPVIPCELITYTQQWNSAGGKQWFEIPALGTVTGILCQDYLGGAISGTKASCLNTITGTSDDISIEYLSTVLRRITPNVCVAENDLSIDLFPSTWANLTGEYMFDFVTDYPGQDAFRLASALDLNPAALSGGKAKVIYSNVTTTSNSFTNFTVRKMFGDLRGITGA